jgi:KDO2-lipid IV(A) lauroyltransferase
MSKLFRWLSRRPLWLLHAFGAALGWLTFLLSPTYRRRFRDNVRQADMTMRQVLPAVAQAGQLVMESPRLWLRPAGEPLAPPVRWDGDALISAAYAQGRGVVFLTPHLGCFEVTVQAVAERFSAEFGPITVLYRPARKRWLRELMHGARERPGVATAPATLAGVRLMIRALRRGEGVGLLPDQVPPEGMGVWAPFFERPAYTMTLAARLIQQTGAVPLLVWGERLPRGAGYVIHISPLRAALPEGSDEAAQAECARLVNEAMEALVRQRPGQYLWGYNRYKQPRANAAFD